MQKSGSTGLSDRRHLKRSVILGFYQIFWLPGCRKYDGGAVAPDQRMSIYSTNPTIFHGRSVVKNASKAESCNARNAPTEGCRAPALPLMRMANATIPSLGCFR